jgi:adenine/guanine phosphoribosyltransferase-like PRPP-binding protein
MFNLGKGRSKFGKYIDKHLGYGGQERVREVSKVSRITISRVCSTDDYTPSGKTMRALLSAVRKLTGKEVKSDDFWNM